MNIVSSRYSQDVQYILRIKHTVHNLLGLVVVSHWLILPICFKVASLALGQSYASASEATLKNISDEYTKDDDIDTKLLSPA